VSTGPGNGTPVPASASSPEATVEATGLTKVFRTKGAEVHALRGIDLTVRRGEMVAIMGASGSGKSTLMTILGCLDYPSEGNYLLDGEPVESLSRNQLADIRNRKIGFVFQGFNLLARTSALENVEMPLLYRRNGFHGDSRSLAREALERVHLSDRADHEPNELSGGQQQRVAIARALVTHPSILFADEPTGNLDTRTSVEVLALFQELNDQGITVLLVTHEHDISGYARRIVELRDGLVIRDEPVRSRRRAADDLAALPVLEEEPS
jgi:putative ABC transport system ATP-binding protein